MSFQSHKDSIKVSIERDTLKIGEQTTLSIQYFYDVVDEEIKWPEFDNFITNDVEIIDKSQVITKPLDSTKTYKFVKQQDFLITSFEPKQHIIPAFEFIHLDSVYLSNPIQLTVQTVPVDTTKGVYDIYPIYEVEYPVTERIADAAKTYWYIFIIIALLIAIYILYKKYKNKPQTVIVEPEIKIPPHVKALQVLNELKQKEAWKNENKKDYYSNLTDTVREYLEERFGIQALEKTTREIINDLKYTNISVDDKHFLREILKQADYVKFAKFKPTDEDGKVALEKSVEFVERTKQPVNSVKSENISNHVE
jgi:hypothetical protein